MRNFRLRNSLRLIVLLCFVCGSTSCAEEEQSPQERYSIALSGDQVQFDPSGGNVTLTLTTNSSWEINTSSDWIAFVPRQSGSAAENITITLSAEPFNEENTTRTASVSIKCGDIATDAVIRRFITVTQNGPIVEKAEPGIYTLKDLVDFGNAIASATKDSDPDFSKWADENGVINLYNDIDAGDTPLPLMGGQTTTNDKSGAFSATFDGHGYTISGRLESNGNPIVALFTRLAPTGVIKNLTVDVEATNDYAGDDVQKHLAGLVGFSVTSTGGYIENCTVKGSLTMTGPTSNPRVGGIVGYGRCNISGCTNYAAITANSTRVAGINGAGGGAFTISDCKNFGTINVSCDAAQVGGIIGQLNGQTLLGCENHGDITLTGGGNSVVGGIAGNSQGSSSIGSADAPCLNTGTVSFNPAESEPSTSCGVGGISGGMSATVPISYCTNEGIVISQANHVNVAAGGIIGTMNKKTTLSNNRNQGAITSAANAGGIVGRATNEVQITDCGNTGDILQLTSATVPASYFGCIAGQGPSVVLTNCTYGGTVLGAPGESSNATGSAAQ